MCRFKSALVLKDRIFLPDYDSHDKMLQELGIKDNFMNASKVFVRVELFPADGNVFSAVDDWEMKVDQDILPEWWNEAERLPQLKELVETWMQKHTISAGNREVTGGVWFATGSATVTATGSATVTAYESATVRATGSATVTAAGSATVRAYGSATVRAYGSATVIACESATVRAYGSATVTATGSATVTATESATVTACESATVIIPQELATDGEIELNANSVCVNHKTHTVKSAIQWKQEE